MTRGPTPPRASHPTIGGQVPEPAIDRAAASEILGSEIARETWGAILTAHEDWCLAIGELDALRMNRNRNDPKSYEVERAKSERRIERALDLIGDQRRKAEFNAAVSQNYSMRRSGLPSGAVIDDLLNQAFDNLAEVVRVLRDAEPRDIAVRSEAEINQEFAGQLLEICRRLGLPAKLSTGFELDDLLDDASGENRKATLDDLTPFERFFDALGIHDAETPATLAAWLRDARKKTRR